MHWLRNGITDCAVRCQYLYLCTSKASKLKSPHTDGTLAAQRLSSITNCAGRVLRALGNRLLGSDAASNDKHEEEDSDSDEESRARERLERLRERVERERD